MRIELIITVAFLVDCLAGDPRWLPHPVRLIGNGALRLEPVLRRLIPVARLAGVVAVVCVVGGTGLAAWLVLQAAAWLHPWAAAAVGVYFIYASIAARDLVAHSVAVLRPLAAGDLPEARRRVAMIVGRDTAELDEAGITRAAVESVAESTVDGVTAPLFYALLFGPIGALVYRAVNTLDSTFGYKDERYLCFGWASARLDDLANWLPARLTVPVMALAAALLGLASRRAIAIVRRDGRKHESPNSGLAEAAMAGALGVQLGGTNYYGGEPLVKPTIGDAVVPLRSSHIRQANVLMYLTTILFLAAGLALRFATHTISN